jgi:NAD(P)H-nitrite reductase large subunit
MATATNKIVSTMMVKPDGSDSRTFVIIGGGAAGNSCAEQLRRDGFRGKIVVLSNEEFLPYDRVTLSKNINGDATKLGLRSSGFYEEYGIEVRLSTTANSIDAERKVVQTSQGEVSYDKL